MTDPARLFVALTSDQGEDAVAMAEPLRGLPGLGVKIGLELFTRCGPDIVTRFGDLGLEVFLDLKFHDIPFTVAGAVRAACERRPSIVNVHASGGAGMMEAAAEAASGSGTRIIAVTVLTSLSGDDLELLGTSLGTAAIVERMAAAALRAGLDGVVCSPLEASAVRASCGPGFLVVTPGIRASGSDRQDQKRTASASEAIAAGATSVVVGRPVTDSPDPRGAAARLLEEIRAALPAGKA